MKKQEQLNLFTQKIKSAFLVAQNSPKSAFYRIWIEHDLDNYRIVKESGIKGRVLDRRSWPAKSMEASQKLFERRVNSKTNPQRKSPRKYTLVHSSGRIHGNGDIET